MQSNKFYILLMQTDFTKIRAVKEYTFRFCICTIVNDDAEYNLMKQSFETAGFIGDCQYIIADNTAENNFDAYTAVRRFLQESDALYTIIVHQDVRCEDSRYILDKCLQSLNEKDPAWAICGNAGAADYKKIVYHINVAGDIRKSPDLPKRVYSLDENLLIIKTETLISVSANIGNFHFYGTDICIVADMLGYTSYVIPFMVKHLSKGNLDDMELKKPAFVKAYGYKLRHRFIQTTCTNFYLGKSQNQNKFLNSKPVFFWVKAKTRLKNLFR